MPKKTIPQNIFKRFPPHAPYIALFLIILPIIIYCLYLANTKNFTIIYKDPLFTHKTVSILLDELNQKTPLFHNQKYDIYITNFKSNHIPQIKNKNHKNIIYLGSSSSFKIKTLNQFDYIFASSVDLQYYLKLNQIESYVLPIFIDKTHNTPAKCVQNPNQEHCFYGILGDFNLPNLQNLPIKNIPSYSKLKYNYDNLIALLLTENKRVKTTLDIPLEILKLQDKHIPVITSNKFYHLKLTNAIYLENPTLDDLTQNHTLTTKRAAQLIQTLDAKSAAQKILETLNLSPKKFILENTISINGNTRLVDTFINNDLAEGLEKQNFNTQIYYPEDIFQDLSYIDIYMRGANPPPTHLYPRKKGKSILYLYYPAVDDFDINHPSVDEYINRMIPEFNKYHALAISSPTITQKLKNKGYNAYYIPQFTNSRRFYYNPQEDLKTDILFVGAKTPYRKAPTYALKHNLPITLYGPYWDKKLIKKEYIDNNELHKHYSSAKIVLHDQRHEMTSYDFISNRIFDITASGGFVISEYVPAIEKVYKDTIPMFKTEEEFVKLINYYLDPKNQKERQEKINQAREITLKYFEINKIASEFAKIINTLK